MSMTTGKILCSWEEQRTAHIHSMIPDLLSQLDAADNKNSEAHQGLVAEHATLEANHEKMEATHHSMEAEHEKLKATHDSLP